MRDRAGMSNPFQEIRDVHATQTSSATEDPDHSGAQPSRQHRHLVRKGKHVRRDQARHKRASGAVGLVESGADVTIKTEVGEKAGDGEVLVRGGVGDGRLRWGKGAAMDCL